MGELVPRRTFMKAAGVAAAGGLLAALVGCGPKWKDARAEDGLVYLDNPFYSKESIEDNLYGGINVKEFGKPDESGQRNYRMLSLQDWKHGFAPRGTDGPSRDKAREVADVLNDEVEQVLMLQKRDVNTGSWESVSLPATIGRFGKLTEMENVLAEKYPSKGAEWDKNDPSWLVRAAVNRAMHTELTTDKDVDEMVAQYFPGNDGWMMNELIKIIRKDSAPLPEDLDMDLIVAIQQAEFFPITGESFQKLNDFAQQSGEVSKLIFVPKHVPDWFKQKIEAWESTFIPLEKEPEVYFITRNNAVTGGEVTQAFVRHMDKNGVPDKVNGAFDSSGKYETVPQYVIDQWIADGVIESMDRVSAEEVGLVENFFRVSDPTLVYSEPKQMYRRVKGKMSIFMIPNDVLGQERARAAHGFKFIEHYTDDKGKMHLIDSVMLFSSKLRDKLVTIQPQLQLFGNWITDRTEQLRPLIDLGITQVDKWGGFSPLQSMAILMEGWNDVLHLAERTLPKSKFTRGMLLNMLYGILRGDYFDKQTNFGVIMEDIPVQFLAARNVAGWVEDIGDGLEKLFKLKKPIKAMSSEHEIIPATEADGTPVILNIGAAVPINEIIQVDGKLYLVIGRTGRDEDYGAGAEEMFAGFKRMGNGLKNRALVDDIEGALVIPFEEARKVIMPLDPDPNMWEVFKVAALLASVAAVVAWPTTTATAAAVGIVTAKGMVGAGLSSVWNWIGVAASQVIANGLKILPFVSGYEPGPEPGGKRVG